MNRRNIILGLVIIVIAAGALYVVTGGLNPSFAYEVIDNGDRQHKENSDYYTVQVNYPDKTSLATRADAGAGAESRAQAATADMIKGLIAQFKDAGSIDNLSQAEKDRLNQDGLKYALNVGYRGFSSGSFVSYEYDVSMDTGGAHPNNFYKTLVFDLKGNTVKLGDLFTSSAYLQKVSELATAQVNTQLSQLAGAGAAEGIIADGLAPKVENFENFVVDSDRIRIFIPPYQAAPYAAGAFEVQIPLADIKDILKPDVK